MKIYIPDLAKYFSVHNGCYLPFGWEDQITDTEILHELVHSDNNVLSLEVDEDTPVSEDSGIHFIYSKYFQVVVNV